MRISNGPHWSRVVLELMWLRRGEIWDSSSCALAAEMNLLIRNSFSLSSFLEQNNSPSGSGSWVVIILARRRWWNSSRVVLVPAEHRNT